MTKWLIIAITLSGMLVIQSCAVQEEKTPEKKESASMSVEDRLIQAAERRDSLTIEKLILEGANLDVQDASGRTAAMIATYNNDLASAKALIEAGADVNLLDHMRNSPFLYAGAEGYLDILKLTIAAGADPSITNRFGGTALIPASEHGYVDVVKELLTQTKVEVNHVNNLGWTALLEAIILNDGNARQQQTIQLLIEHEADVNIPDGSGVSPLKHAQKMGFTEIEAILLKAGAK